MQGSWSRSRFQELSLNSSSPSICRTSTPTAADTEEELPICDPRSLSRVARRERSRLRLAQNAVHAIPLVVLICAFILWFFSNPRL